MKAEKKPRAIKHRIREERKRKERTAVAAAASVAIILISSFFSNYVLNQPSSQTANSTSELKAAIVDHLSLTYLNQTFIQTATNTLKQAGYTVDYYPGEQVTVEFYRNLPTHDYGLILLRVHSSAAALEGKDFVDAPACFFTSENYSRTKYVWEQLTDQLVIATYSQPQSHYYFGIIPKFVTSSMNGKFQNTIVIMMGCEGLRNAEMAKAFLSKGAKVYIGWNGPVSASHTDYSTEKFLKRLLIGKQTIDQALLETFEEAGSDPAYSSQLIYYPPEAASYHIQNIVGRRVVLDTAPVIKHRVL